LCSGRSASPRLSERTATYTRAARRIWLMRAPLFPYATEPYRPADPALREAYAPIPLDGTSAGSLSEARFTERDELDRAMFEVVSRMAKARVNSDDTKVLEQGLYYLRRAERLSGVSDEQRQSLQEMHSDVAYYLARSKLDHARGEVAEALAQLKLAATTPNRHAHSANQMILEVEPAAKAFEQSLRKAAHGLSSPADAQPEAKNPPFGGPELKATDGSAAPSKP